MCFVIDSNAPAPRNRTAWKVVSLRPSGAVLSLNYMEKRWYPGEHRISSNDPTESADGSRAECGFYVYLSKYAAMRSYVYRKYRDMPRGRSEIILLKVLVDPKNHLHTSRSNSRIATYRAVVVPEDQPEIEFYA